MNKFIINYLLVSITIFSLPSFVWFDKGELQDGKTTISAESLKDEKLSMLVYEPSVNSSKIAQKALIEKCMYGDALSIGTLYEPLAKLYPIELNNIKEIEIKTRRSDKAIMYFTPKGKLSSINYPNSKGQTYKVHYDETGEYPKVISDSISTIYFFMRDNWVLLYYCEELTEDRYYQYINYYEYQQTGNDITQVQNFLYYNDTNIFSLLKTYNPKTRITDTYSLYSFEIRNHSKIKLIDKTNKKEGNDDDAIDQTYTYYYVTKTDSTIEAKIVYYENNPCDDILTKGEAFLIATLDKKGNPLKIELKDSEESNEDQTSEKWISYKYTYYK